MLRVPSTAKTEMELRLRERLGEPQAAALCAVLNALPYAVAPPLHYTDTKQYGFRLRTFVGAGGAPPELTFKEKVGAHVDFLLAIDGARPLAVRLAVSAEHSPPPPPSAPWPPMDHCEYVRLAVRRSWTVADGSMRWDLTEVRGGATEAAAASAPVVFELELEALWGVDGTPDPGIDTETKLCAVEAGVEALVAEMQKVMRKAWRG